jgi:sterol desaturase/sphingolipid hydroxylase (fatty acid hydroxylase superfamily)
MAEWYTYEGAVRIGVFGSVLVIMALFEAYLPRRELRFGRGSRWLANAGLIIIDTAILRFVMPVLAVGAALWAQQAGFGLLNMTGLWLGAQILLTVVLMDFFTYVQHFAAHKVPLFWRIHRVHHTDPDLDVTTAVRFHPLEIVLSMTYKIAIVVALGVPAWGVVVYELMVSACSLFNHANVSLPARVDAVVRRVFVTPDMHLVHHSTVQKETDTNFGSIFSFWDRLFRTYSQEPAAGKDAMIIGLEETQTAEPTRLGWLLMVPFRRFKPAPQKNTAGSEAHRGGTRSTTQPG